MVREVQNRVKDFMKIKLILEIDGRQEVLQFPIYEDGEAVTQDPRVPHFNVVHDVVRSQIERLPDFDVDFPG